jgi:hypothetical protein
MFLVVPNSRTPRSPVRLLCEILNQARTRAKVATKTAGPVRGEGPATGPEPKNLNPLIASMLGTGKGRREDMQSKKNFSMGLLDSSLRWERPKT